MPDPGQSEEIGGTSNPIWRVKCKVCSVQIDVVAKPHLLNDKIRERGWWSKGKPLQPIWHCNKEPRNETT